MGGGIGGIGGGGYNSVQGGAPPMMNGGGVAPTSQRPPTAPDETKIFALRTSGRVGSAETDGRRSPQRPALHWASSSMIKRRPGRALEPAAAAAAAAATAAAAAWRSLSRWPRRWPRFRPSGPRWAVSGALPPPTRPTHDYKRSPNDRHPVDVARVDRSSSRTERQDQPRLRARGQPPHGATPTRRRGARPRQAVVADRPIWR